ncbi:MAG TPA: aldehyde ferredoxin oxidoreductase family protein [Dehalococcoidia bacterium]|nr:aldehyde ferredoxin oxidoreductase family protein [Dehalococcoidia bacterium]
MARGYMGKMLMVDLSKNELRDEPLDDKFCRQFIGGYGIGVRILFSRQKAGVDPLGPDNTFGILTGPFTGTAALSGTRHTVVGKSPLTGGWGDANSGGYFGSGMKFAGYDAVFFAGTSEKPVYLFINNGKAELKDATRLWGKDTYQTQDILKSELGKNIEVACIGQSGENLSLISAVVSRSRTAARSGLGAVMGSKRLKAVVVKGNMKVPVADEERTRKLRRKYLGQLGGHIVWLKPIGTPFLTVPGVQDGDSPVKNWGGVGVIDFPNSEPIGADAVIERRSKRFACYLCPIGCGGYMKAGTGEYKYKAGARRPEYETIAMFGTNCLNNNLESIIKANDICDRHGLDTISTGATIAFAIECFENGLISKTDTDGIEMTWGNHRAIVAMTEKLATREGFGAVLADGVKVAAEKIGKGADKYAMHIQGQELPAHDPKGAFFYATGYRLDPTPGRHFVGSELSMGPEHPKGLLPRFDHGSFAGRGEARKIGGNFHHALVCAGMCLFVYWAYPNVEPIAEFMRAVTGWDITNDELLRTGERISNIRQAFNIREGLNPMEFKVPDRVLGQPPHTEGPLAGVTIDEKTLDKEYLAAMDWDLKTAKPSKKKLLELDLADVAQELWP